MQSLYSSIKIVEEKVIIDPLTLFLLLVVMVERKTEEEIKKYFEYKLSQCLMSLLCLMVIPYQQNMLHIKSFPEKQVQLSK